MATNNLQQTQPQIIVREIQDLYLRQNFKNLQDYFTVQNQLLDFKFIEVTFTEAQENYKLAHGLNYAPKDIIVTYITGSGLVKFNIGLFDTTSMDITVTEACTVRFYYGTYWNFKSLVNAQPSDVMTFGADTLSSLESQIAALQASITSLRTSITTLSTTTTTTDADYLQLGERNVADLTGIVCLGAYISTGGKATFRDPNGTAGYVVPTGKTLTLLGMTISAAIAAGAQITVNYSDADVGFNSVTAFTNPFYLFNDVQFAPFKQGGGNAAAGPNPGMLSSFALNFQIPAGKYPGLVQIAGGSNFVDAMVWGKLS